MKKLYLLPILLIPVLLLFSCGQMSMTADGYGKTTLPNGITLLVNHDETTALSAARILIAGGVLSENRSNNGITNLMTRMLLKGNDGMSGADVTDRLEFLGADVSANCFKDCSAISIMSLTENFNEVLEIVGRSVLFPAFPEQELEKLKHETEGDIRFSDDNQSQASSKLFWRTAYGEQSYGLPTLGTLESIADLTGEDIRDHYEQLVGGRGLVISVSSDLPPERIVALVEEHFGGLTPEATEVPAPSGRLQSEKIGFISYDRNQSYVYKGAVLPHIPGNELPYLMLLNKIMGSGVGSRLWFLRQREKLAYEVYTQFITNRYGALFRAAIGTDTSKVQTALQSLDREWTRMIEEGVTEEELVDAKVSLKNSLIYGIDTKSNRAGNMAFYEYEGYGHRYIVDILGKIDAITLDQVNAFIQSRLTEDRTFLSVVGKM